MNNHDEYRRESPSWVVHVGHGPEVWYLSWSGDCKNTREGGDGQKGGVIRERVERGEREVIKEREGVRDCLSC